MSRRRACCGSVAGKSSRTWMPRVSVRAQRAPAYAQRAGRDHRRGLAGAEHLALRPAAAQRRGPASRHSPSSAAAERPMTGPRADAVLGDRQHLGLDGCGSARATPPRPARRCRRARGVGRRPPPRGSPAPSRDGGRGWPRGRAAACPAQVPDEPSSKPAFAAARPAGATDQLLARGGVAGRPQARHAGPAASSARATPARAADRALLDPVDLEALAERVDAEPVRDHEEVRHARRHRAAGVGGRAVEDRVHRAAIWRAGATPQ